MTSPARRHFLRATAAAAAAQDPAAAPQTATAYELMLYQLAEHRRQLKQLQSIDRKVAAKRQFLPDYEPWVEGVLAGNHGGQDDVLVTVMVWRIDVGDLTGALPLIDYALRHGLSMPDQYHRGIAVVAAEEFADYALRQLQATGTADAAPLLQVAELTAAHDMHDEVRAKLHKAIGYALRDSDPAAALAHLNTALQRHDKVGVKKDIERLERQLRQPNTAPAESGQG